MAEPTHLTGRLVRACAGCGRPTANVRCRRCTIGENQRRHVKAVANGLHSAHWANVREQRLALDGHLCTIRRPGCTVRATTVHLDPELRGDHLKATLQNTRSACRSCHGTVDAPRAARSHA